MPQIVFSLEKLHFVILTLDQVDLWEWYSHFALSSNGWRIVLVRTMSNGRNCSDLSWEWFKSFVTNCNLPHTALNMIIYPYKDARRKYLNGITNWSCLLKYKLYSNPSHKSFPLFLHPHSPLSLTPQIYPTIIVFHAKTKHWKRKSTGGKFWCMT